MTSVTFETATLAVALKKAASISPRKGSAFDKAAGILMEFDPGDPTELVIKATNIDVFYAEWVDVVSIEGTPGPVVWRLPGQLLAAVVASLPIGTGKTVKLEEVVNGAQKQVKLQSGRTRSTFMMMNAEYYPDWSPFDPDLLVTTADMGGRLAQVEWAAHDSEAPLNGVHLDGEIAVATDKYRVCCVPFKLDISQPVTVPANILSQVLRQTGEISIAIEDGQMLLMPDEHTQIRTVIFAAEYPNVRRILDNNRTHPETIKLNKNHLLEIMRRALTFTGSDRIPTMRVFVGKEEIAVQVVNQEIGMLGDVIDVTGYATHDRIEFKFTPANLMEALEKAPSEIVTISYDPAKPTRLMYITGDSGYEAWVMPRAEGVKSG